MATSLVDAQSVLAVDIGSIHTRALLFDVVDNQYRFIAAGVTDTTAIAPFFNVIEGVHGALVKLQDITGRELLDERSSLIIPASSDGAGVDCLVLTVSAGPELRVVTAGLLPDVSLESAQKLAATTYGRVVESIGLNDRRRTEAQLDSILKARPDIIIISGGTDRGATRSVLKMADLAATVCRLLPHDQRPDVVYAGNQALEKKIKEGLEKLTRVQTAPNIRPGIDTEDLRPAQDVLAGVVSQVRARQLGGLSDLANAAAQPLLPTSHAFGRMVRLLSGMYPGRPVLGVDLGASATVLAAAQSGKLTLNVFRPLGTGSGALPTLQQGKLEEIVQWLPLHVPDETVRDTIWQKNLYPASLPLTGETLAIEQAVARQALRLAVREASPRWSGFTGPFEMVVAAGAVFAGAATPGQALLMLLDGLQPTGITRFFLDVNSIMPALGAVASLNSLLPVQVIDSGGLLPLGTVITAASPSKYGTSIMKVRVDTPDGNSNLVEIKQGTLTSVPLPTGQTAQVSLELLRKVEIDPKRRETKFTVTGGACGLVIDARGRPLALPTDAPRRRDQIKKWSMALS